MFSIRNTVILALMQIGVIVAGVLAAGLCHKLWAGGGGGLPLPTAILYDYGVWWFSIPIAWFIMALVPHGWPEISDDVRNLAFLSGILVLLALIVFILDADIAPWLRMDYGMAGG